MVVCLVVEHFLAGFGRGTLRTTQVLPSKKVAKSAGLSSIVWTGSNKSKLATSILLVTMKLRIDRRWMGKCHEIFENHVIVNVTIRVTSYICACQHCH